MTLIPESIHAKLAGLAPSQAPYFPFPWDGLEDHIVKERGGRLPLVGYGSLLNKASADRTIKDGATRRTPCLAFGCRRVFNYTMPESLLERYSTPPTSPNRAALNVVTTGDFRDVINGVIITVHVADLAALKQREYGYDLVPVHTLPWHSPENSPITVAYVLSAPDVASRPEYQRADPAILPSPAYATLCEEGAAETSPEFLAMYRGTTYLADKLTLWKP